MAAPRDSGEGIGEAAVCAASYAPCVMDADRDAVLRAPRCKVMRAAAWRVVAPAHYWCGTRTHEGGRERE